MSNNNFDDYDSNSSDPGPFTRRERADLSGEYGGRGGGYRPPVQSEMEFKDWVILNIVLLIPCINIIMLLIWGFSKDNKTRSDFCKAYMLVYLVAIILSFVIFFVFGLAVINFATDMMLGGW